MSAETNFKRQFIHVFTTEFAVKTQGDRAGFASLTIIWSFFDIVLYSPGGLAYNPPRRRREHGQHGQRLAAIFCCRVMPSSWFDGRNYPVGIFTDRVVLLHCEYGRDA